MRFSKEVRAMFAKIGRKGGSMKSERKTAAARRSAQLGREAYARGAAARCCRLRGAARAVTATSAEQSTTTGSA